MPTANASPVWSRSQGFHQSLSNPGGKTEFNCLIPNPPLSARRPFCCTDVLRDIDASFNGSDEGVLHAPQPDGILTALVAGPRFLAEDGSVVGDAPEQPQDTVFVYHGLPVPAGDTGRELPMRAGDARELVEVNLPGSGLPPDPGDGIILEEQPAACRYPPG